MMMMMMMMMMMKYARPIQGGPKKWHSFLYTT